MDVHKEVLKGHIDTLILSLLNQKGRYGYELAKVVRERSNDQFELKEGTLYLSLKRLENNGSVESYWGDEQGAGGRRKYYSITPVGKESYQLKKDEWLHVRSMMDLFLGSDDGYETN